MKPSPAPDNPMPPWPGAKVNLATYTKVQATNTGTGGAAARKPETKVADTPAARALRAHIEQAMDHLSRDALGEPREPTSYECEALEDLRRALNRLAIPVDSAPDIKSPTEEEFRLARMIAEDVDHPFVQHAYELCRWYRGLTFNRDYAEAALTAIREGTVREPPP